MNLSGIKQKGWLYTTPDGEFYTDDRREWEDAPNVETVTPVYTIPTAVAAESLRHQAANIRDAAQHTDRNTYWRAEMEIAAKLERQADAMDGTAPTQPAQAPAILPASVRTQAERIADAMAQMEQMLARSRA